jgi:catechol 2,3-dioxygenase-like lactoylglutathione lyase family enzyme
MKLLNAIPALPVRDLMKSIAFYRDKLGFTDAYHEDGFARLTRDGVEINLWVSGDDSWRTRGSEEPIISGAESFIAGTASCRIGVQGVDELYAVVKPLGVLHPCGEIVDQHFGTREFAVSDPDNNLITFFQRK